MDWQLIYRDEAELASYAREIQISFETWTDPTGCIAWCEMKDGAACDLTSCQRRILLLMARLTRWNLGVSAARAGVAQW